MFNQRIMFQPKRMVDRNSRLEAIRTAKEAAFKKFIQDFRQSLAALKTKHLKANTLIDNSFIAKLCRCIKLEVIKSNKIRLSNDQEVVFEYDYIEDLFTYYHYDRNFKIDVVDLNVRDILWQYFQIRPTRISHALYLKMKVNI